MISTYILLCIGSLYETNIQTRPAFQAPRRPYLDHLPVPAPFTASFNPSPSSAQSHSSTSDHGWFPDPLPSHSTSQNSSTHQQQVGGMSTALSTSDLQQRLHNPTFIVSVYRYISSVCLIY
jgi:hypothetical protein